MVRVRKVVTIAVAVMCGGLAGCSAAADVGQASDTRDAAAVSPSPPAAPVAEIPRTGISGTEVPAASDQVTPTVDVTPESAPEPSPRAAPEPSPQSVPPALDARSPEEVVTAAGYRGRRYLDALRGAGLPPTGMDAAEILYADGTCRALASGTPRAAVLKEFDGVARAYAQFTPLPPDRVAEIYVAAAEQAYC